MSTPDHWRQWLRGFPREPEDRLALALGAVDAFETLSSGRSTDDQAVRVLTGAASSPYKLVFETGCYLLVRLAATQLSCQQAIESMASSQSSIARLHAVAYLDASLPNSLRLSVINRALSDRSSRVRAMAVQQAEVFGFRDLLPRLEDMIASESRTDVQESLALHIALLRDGFRLRPDESGFFLTVRTPDSALVISFIPQQHFSDSYVKDAVERLKKGEPLTHWLVAAENSN